MSKQKYKTRYFRLEWNCTCNEFYEFLQAVKKVSIKASYFRAQIGEIYLSVKGLSDESDLYGNRLFDVETIEDVLFNYRKQIRVLGTLVSKPKPELNYTSVWIDLGNLPLPEAHV